VLRKFLTYPMQDVKTVSILTIAHIGRTGVTPLLADALLNPQYRKNEYRVIKLGSRRYAPHAPIKFNRGIGTFTH